MHVKMLVQTHYGQTLRPDDVINVSGETGERWVSRGIAEATDEEVTVNNSAVQAEAADGQSGGNEEADKGPYDGMKAKELYELCKERNIEAEARKSEAHYFELLMADDKAKAKAAE